ncbi:MarR family winged helix-turn-helix transcriptional regulator [Methylobacterium sp. CM6257]
MPTEIVEEMARHCFLSRSRLLSRAVTAIYDETLRPLRIQASQFSLLVLIAKIGPARRADMARVNQQDRSTLTRNLRIMLREGWIDEVPDKNGKGRLVQVSERGLHLLSEAAPAWREAQVQATALLGPAGSGAVAEIGTRLFNEEPA